MNSANSLAKDVHFRETQEAFAGMLIAKEAAGRVLSAA